MANIARYLISTADERTWKFDRPVVFLGDWCRLYGRKHIWQNMDAIVASPYGLGQAKKDADYAKARALEESLFPRLCETLNKYHGTQHGERYWRILIGHWLQRVVDVLLNRVNTIEQCFQENRISGFSAYANDHYVLATQDSHSAIWAFNDNRWNNALTVRILNLLGKADIPIEIVVADPDVKALPNFRFKAMVCTQSLKELILRGVLKNYNKIARLLMRNEDAFIINSYLPRKEAIKLELALGQWPQMWTSPTNKIVEMPDRLLRENLTKEFGSKSGDNLEIIINALLFELLPVCYLEGFAALNNIVRQQAWPKRPKFIFTSNNFDTDEVFKLWAVQRIESGSKYIIGQHGNNYGVHRYDLNPSVEEVTADKFLTWGWTDGLAQHTPAFVFKTAGRKDRVYNPNGGLLLIELCVNHRITTWDGISEFADYFQDQQIFINKLLGAPRSNLVVRLHATYRYLGWDEDARWQAFDRTIKIDAGGTKIRDMIARSRLVVHSYDSTGILETLSQNIPTLAFWQNGFDHLRESAKPYYQLLVDAEIVHLSPESVAEKVNAIWDDVNGWWRQGKVQEARQQFCDRYARTSDNPVKEIKEPLNKCPVSATQTNL